MTKAKLILGKDGRDYSESDLIFIKKDGFAYCGKNLEDAINNINLQLQEFAEKLSATHIFVEEYTVIDDFGDAIIVQAFGEAYRQNKVKMGVYR